MTKFKSIIIIILLMMMPHLKEGLFELDSVTNPVLAQTVDIKLPREKIDISERKRIEGLQRKIIPQEKLDNSRPKNLAEAVRKSMQQLELAPTNMKDSLRIQEYVFGDKQQGKKEKNHDHSHHSHHSETNSSIGFRNHTGMLLLRRHLWSDVSEGR